MNGRYRRNVAVFDCSKQIKSIFQILFVEVNDVRLELIEQRGQVSVGLFAEVTTDHPSAKVVGVLKTDSTDLHALAKPVRQIVHLLMSAHGHMNFMASAKQAFGKAMEIELAATMRA